VLDVLRGVDLIEDDGRRISLSDAGRLLHDRVTLALFPRRALDWLLERQEIAAAS
jgi:hypothetical protein